MSNVGERELLAIIFTDAVDSTARTASDEEFSLKILLADLDYMRNEAAVRGGTVLKNTGDGLLISFKSAVDAVECALSIQRGFANRAENAAFTHKIGVHIGDVIKKDGDIYGSGVNTASRLVAQCPAGGLCMSSTLYELVKQKSQIGNLKMAEFQLTNIEPPIKAYKITEPQPNTAAILSNREKNKNKRRRFHYVWCFVAVTVVSVGLYATRETLLLKPTDQEKSPKIESQINASPTGLGEKDAIVGVWLYGNGAKTTFYPDGTVKQVWDGGGTFGKVEKIDEKKYAINFNNNQWTETVQIDLDSGDLDGKNNYGEPVAARKITSQTEEESNSAELNSLAGIWQNRAYLIPDRFYVIQDGNKVMWYGEERKENPKWAHIMVGEKTDNKIVGYLYDLPKGKARFSGKIAVEVVSTNEMSVQFFIGFNQKEKPDYSWTMIRNQKR